jgi:hypothetical protein
MSTQSTDGTKKSRSSLVKPVIKSYHGMLALLRSLEGSRQLNESGTAILEVEPAYIGVMYRYSYVLYFKKDGTIKIPETRPASLKYLETVLNTYLPDEYTVIKESDTLFLQCVESGEKLPLTKRTYGYYENYRALLPDGSVMSGRAARSL